MNARRFALAVVVALSLCAPRRLSAQPSEAETVARKVLIVLRVLAYDRALATRAPGTEVTVLVVNAPTKDGRADRDRWLSGFALLPNVKAGGRRVRAQSVELANAAALDATIERLRPAMVIVGSGLSRELATIKSVTRHRDVLSFTTRESEVRLGIAAGLVSTDEGDEIVVNLDAARAEGAKLSAGLLELARLVDEVRR